MQGGLTQIGIPKNANGSYTHQFSEQSQDNNPFHYRLNFLQIDIKKEADCCTDTGMRCW